MVKVEGGSLEVERRKQGECEWDWPGEKRRRGEGEKGRMGGRTRL